MTRTLHLGVVDIPYSGKLAATVAEQFAALKRGKPMSKSAARASVTTGDVASFLEARYGVMEVFFAANADRIGEAVVRSLQISTDNVLMGQPPPNDPFASATSAIETMFQKFIESGAIEWLGIAGVPTQAALDGVNHRLARPYAQTNPRRPSFIDTGLYLSSFSAWVDEQ